MPIVKKIRSPCDRCKQLFVRATKHTKLCDKCKKTNKKPKHEIFALRVTTEDLDEIKRLCSNKNKSVYELFIEALNSIQ